MLDAMAAPDFATQARRLALPVLAMAAVVVAANVLVQYPFQPLGLQNELTWGAFAYPVAFLITDLTNRRYGAGLARRLVILGFFIAIGLSFAVAPARIAIASGTAFLVGQLLDVAVFNRLRAQGWWRAPLIGSLAGSALDTLLFFSIAFAGIPEMSQPVPFALLPALSLPLWGSLAVWDGVVKTLIALLALVPYGALLAVVRPVERVSGA